MTSTPPIGRGVIATMRRVGVFMATRGVPCHLVGGLVRDQLLGRPRRHVNVDLAVPTSALVLARELAAELRAAFVPLDAAAGTARVVVVVEGTRCELDLSDYRGPTLEADLARRDFTVNAIAISLSDWLHNPQQLAPLVDPLDGQAALRRHELIACFPGTFEEDPVRLLRAFRFSVQLGFALAPSTGELMRQSVARLADVSGERLRDELMAVFETDQAAFAVRGLEALGALDVLFPELVPGRGLDQGPFHHLDVLAHEVEAVHQADRFLADFAEFSEPLRQPLGTYCAEELVERRSRKALMKLATLLHDVGKPSSRQVHPDGEIWFLGHEHTGLPLTQAIVERLKLSNREAEMVCRLVLHHLRPGFLSREPQLTRRAVYRFFKELGEDGPACLLEWWADRMATRGSQSRLDQVDQQRGFLEEMLGAYFFKAEEVVRPPRLIDGHQLMQTLSLKPGPVIGELLAAIEEAQAEGRIRSADEALALARAHLEHPKST